MNKMMIYLQSSKTAPRATGDRSRGFTPPEFALREQQSETAATTARTEGSNETLPADAVPLTGVIARIKYLASLEPTELATKMDTEEGATLAQVETEPVELKSLLRPWNAIRRASPAQLTDEQYDAFLKGEHPIADDGELYGAHLQSDT
jgi:hypothetical protein